VRHFVYILQSLRDGKYYVGETKSVSERLNFHNRGLHRSTKHRIPFRLVLTEEYCTRADALWQEKGKLKVGRQELLLKGL
jgi:putative endonuclease